MARIKNFAAGHGDRFYNRKYIAAALAAAFSRQAASLHEFDGGGEELLTLLEKDKINGGRIVEEYSVTLGYEPE